MAKAEPMTTRRALLIAVSVVKEYHRQTVAEYGRKDVVARELQEVISVLKRMLPKRAG